MAADHQPMIASVMRKASRLARTSCTRCNMTPRCLAHEVMATVGQSRSLMSLLSSMPAMQDFLETPSNSGRPAGAIWLKALRSAMF